MVTLVSSLACWIAFSRFLLVDCLHHARSRSSPLLLNAVGAAAPASLSASSYGSAAAKARVLRRTAEEVGRVEAITNESRWMIVDGKLYRRYGNKPINYKTQQMAHLISSVLANACDSVPDVAFDVDVSSVGTSIKDRPVLAIARKFKEADGGILVPNPYFEGVRKWATLSDIFFTEAAANPWAARDEHLFWRGVVDWNSSADGKRERSECASLSDRSPEFFDVKAVSRLLLSARDPKEHVAVKSFVPPADYCHWKYLVNLPGRTSGSYSRNLNHLWTTGSVVMQWESNPGKGPNFEEWYYPGLESNVTHVEAGSHNAETMVKYLREHDEMAQQIRSAGAAVYDNFICPCCIASHFVNVFRQLGEKMTFEPKEVLKSEFQLWKHELAKDSEKNGDRDCFCKT